MAGDAHPSPNLAARKPLPSESESDVRASQRTRGSGAGDSSANIPAHPAVAARRRIAGIRFMSPAESAGLSIHPAHAQILHHEVVLDAVLRTLAAHARFLDPAKRRDFGGDDAGVYADDAVLERLGDAPHAVEVAPVEVRREAEFGVVGEADRVFFVLEAEEWC